MKTISKQTDQEKSDERDGDKANEEFVELADPAVENPRQNQKIPDEEPKDWVDRLKPMHRHMLYFTY